MSETRQTLGSSRRDLIAAFATGLFVAAVVVPPTLHSCVWTPDTIDYLGIANAWVNGAGLVDPVKWNYYLAAPVPLPAFAVRAPVPPLLAAIPLALGGGVSTIAGWHALLLAVSAAGLVLFGRRLMSLTTSIVVALLVTLSPAAVKLAPIPLSDIPALVTLLIVLASARGVLTSSRGAALCALANILCWATRPNLGAVFVAVLVAVIWELGPRRAAARRSLWVYFATFVGCMLALNLTVRATTGFAPYEGYGYMYQTSPIAAVFRYDYTYVGTAAFIIGHVDVIVPLMLANARVLFAALFTNPTFWHVGWVALPGVAYCLLPGRGRFERRLCAFAAMGLTVLMIATWIGLDWQRYPLPAVLCGTVCGGAMIDDLVQATLLRLGPRARSVATGIGATLLAAVLAWWLADSGFALLKTSLASAAYALRSGRAAGPECVVSPEVRALCREIPPGAVVSAVDPWTVHLACGNPSILLPFDLGGSASRQLRFVTEQRPRFIVATTSDRQWRWVHDAGFRLVARNGSTSLFSVREADPGETPWPQPPPLACAGQPDACRDEIGR